MNHQEREAAVDHTLRRLHIRELSHCKAYRRLDQPRRACGKTRSAVVLAIVRSTNDHYGHEARHINSLNGESS